MASNKENSQRKWTSDETNLFCEILADPVNNFMQTLERKALKKASRKEVFEDIALDFNSGFQDQSFLENNDKHFKGKRKHTA